MSYLSDERFIEDRYDPRHGQTARRARSILQAIDDRNLGLREIQRTATPRKSRRLPIWERQRLLGTVSAEAAGRALAKNGTDKRPEIEATIAKTIRFTHEVLEFESSTHTLAQGYDRWKARRNRDSLEVDRQKRAGLIGEKVGLLTRSQQVLPLWNLPLDGSLEPLDLSYAALYGMTRAGFQPQAFGNLDVWGPSQLDRRMDRFLDGTEAMVRGLGEEKGPVGQLGDNGIIVSQAMRMAENPTKSVVIAAALQISRDYARA